MATMQVPEIATKFVAALKGDIDGLREICAPDCQLWHSNDNKWMLQGPALEAFAQAQKAGRIPSFGDIVVTPTGKGFLAQTSMTLDPFGTMHIVQLMTVQDGKITSLEEYIAPEMDMSAAAQ